MLLLLHFSNFDMFLRVSGSQARETKMSEENPQAARPVGPFMPLADLPEDILINLFCHLDVGKESGAFLLRVVRNPKRATEISDSQTLFSRKRNVMSGVQISRSNRS